MINTNEFMNLYTNKNNNFVKEKNKVLEEFRTKEENLRNYDEILTELEKVKSSTKIDSFDNIKEKLFYFLLDFNTDNINENVEKVESVIAFLQTKENELKKLSESFSFIKKTWLAFIKRRELEDITTKFMEEINEKIQTLHESFFTSGIDEIGRLEQATDDLKQEVLKVINLFEDFYILLEQNVFIGKEANVLKSDIEEFLEKDFYESRTVDLIKRKEKISFDLKEVLNHETKYSKKGIPVVKVIRKDKNDYYFYTLRFNDYILEFQNENIDLHLSDIEETGEYLYLDEYPENGIFKIKDIKEKLRISFSQYEAMEEVDLATGKIFYGISFLLIVATILSVFNIINILSLLFTAIFLSGIFYFSFKGILSKTKSKYKVKNAFFFIPINYYFVKEGDINFNYKDVIFNIFINAEKTILREKEQVDG